MNMSPRTFALELPRKANRTEYRCEDCGREVNYPETLCRDGRCVGCHKVEV